MEIKLFLTCDTYAEARNIAEALGNSMTEDVILGSTGCTDEHGWYVLVRPPSFEG